MFTGITPRTDLGTSSMMRHGDYSDPDLGLLQSYDDVKKFEMIMRNFINKKKQELNVI